MKLVTEFVGTFLFLFVISLAATGNSPLAPLAIGAALMVMVYMGGHRSGGHYNPAVSFGLFLQKKLDAKDLIPYWVAQILGGIGAFGVGYWVSGKTVGLGPGKLAGDSALITTQQFYTPAAAFIVETIFTLALVLVVLNTACSKKTAGNSFYGLAIGFTIVIAAVAGGPISGGAFNPAVAIGATVWNATQSGGSWGYLWIPVVGPLLGGAIGSYIWKFQEAKDVAPAD